MAALTLAIPSKGRLKDDCNAYFADAGAVLKQTAGARGYRGTLSGFPDIEVMLLSAGEIAAALLAGDVHLGITGEDLLREAAPELDGRIHLVRPLGFGFANVVVAVPQYWIDVATMADLDDVCAAFAHRHRRRLRIATKYVQLTRSHFAGAGISDYRIVESTGATEGAPAAAALSLRSGGNDRVGRHEREPQVRTERAPGAYRPGRLLPSCRSLRLERGHRQSPDDASAGP